MQINGVVMPSTREIGAVGEQIAIQALQTHQYRIVERNWQWVGGEADIIAQHGDFYVLVEVKLRRSGGEHAAEEAITQVKKTKLLSTAQVYMTEHSLTDFPWRIDVVAIDMTMEGKVLRLALYQRRKSRCGWRRISTV
jgi:putative endonuclease